MNADLALITAVATLLALALAVPPHVARAQIGDLFERLLG